jgi:hypothetical protein
MKLNISPLPRISDSLRRQVLTRVRAALVPHQPREYRLVVDPRDLEMRGDEWLVVVRPDQDGAPLGDCVTRMMAAEDDLRRRWRMNVSLLPTMPPEDD